MARRRPLMAAATSLIVLILSAQALTAQQADKPDALAMYRNGQYALAMQTTLDEIQQMPKNMDSYSVLGWSLLKLGRYQEAVDYAKRALAISRYDNRIVEILGEAYYFLGDNAQAIKYFEEYTVLAPTGERIDDVYYYMGEIYIRMGDYNHADIAFSTAVYHSPNIAQWWTRLGYAREMAKQYKLSLQAYGRALQLNPSFVDAVRGRERVQAAMAGG
ncbi:MAG TPA: tetratricopeptide repeat protein [Spirochaetia bacterium]|nr:tetratricopeptide repeat protein [Spirochaetia bacterium]